jgi:hypothetical protein
LISKVAITIENKNNNALELIEKYKSINVFDFVFLVHSELKEIIDLEKYSSGEVCLCNEQDYIFKIAEIFKDCKDKEKYCILTNDSTFINDVSIDKDFAISKTDFFDYSIIFGKPDFWDFVFKKMLTLRSNFDFLKNSSCRSIFEKIIDSFSIEFNNLKDQQRNCHEKS